MIGTILATVAGTAVSVVAGWLTKNLQELEMNK
jgi:hypothetical protein